MEQNKTPFECRVKNMSNLLQILLACNSIAWELAFSRFLKALCYRLWCSMVASVPGPVFCQCGGLHGRLPCSHSSSHGLSWRLQLQAWLWSRNVSSHKCLICGSVDFCLASLFVISRNASFPLRIFGNFIETCWLP